MNDSPTLCKVREEDILKAYAVFSTFVNKLGPGFKPELTMLDGKWTGQASFRLNAHLLHDKGHLDITAMVSAAEVINTDDIYIRSRVSELAYNILEQYELNLEADKSSRYESYWCRLGRLYK